ncbi:TadE/TadG family type IV pilus assembly protein [Lignipirellula cremea]|uniref:TadE/TadG family type IV pilus assembly protein n=1 Tax=Lignipirellula cremea TaxID=2528010 RepID=UPI0028F40101|nr:TadE/TadG family type IV pilus assembly protein [Lignipirellula cremea]
MGDSAEILTPQDSKLHKVCRLYRLKRHGATVVEFAFVAPIFILLIFGMIEFGRMVMVQQVLTNASREGARRAVLDGTTSDEVQTVVTEYLAQSAVSSAGVKVTPDPPTTAGYGEPVTVVVTVGYDDVSWLPGSMFLGGTQMTATTVMRRETVQ